jgi:WD40 repeat protein
LASAHSDGVRLWDLSRFREIAHFGDSGCEAVAFHPNGQSLFAAGQSGLQQWPMEFHQNEQSNILSIGPPLSFGAPMKVDALALSPDGRTLATAKDRLLRVFDARTGQERHRLSGPARSWSVSFGQDGRWVASAPFGRDDVMVWSLPTGTLQQKLPLQDSAQIAFSPDNKWLVTASSLEYHFWEVGTWKPAHSIPRKGASDHAGVLSFTADGKMLAIAEGRSSVRLLDPDTCREWATLEAPMPSEITRLQFNADGSQLAAACRDGHVIQLWDLRLIRQQLAAMKLDWDLPPWPSANKVNGAEILEVTIATGSETK